MPKIRLPTLLRPYVNGQSEVPVQGKTPAEAVQDLVTMHPSLQPHLFNNQGQLRPFISLFLGGNNINELQGFETQLSETDTLILIPSIAGG